MTNGIGTVTAVIAILAVLGLLVAAASNVLDQSVTSLLGNQSEEGVINESSKFSYGDDEVTLSNLEKERYSKEGKSLQWV